ncbi:DUF4369 domain-containing protein [uncultured Lacinutrix sp.]|uniref:DUF4369 domain-containing protein n=1 Tax=uncultured Lacinutrix sp. TaxID=574032 RepID=UPI002606643E|nr:DUF4369 domain-containing protein [uncultured Lacinutrix sp.]
MQKILALLCLSLFFSCGNETTDKLIVKGNIKGLKKGTVYLKKAQDTILITVDSLVINGSSSFELQSDIKEPEVYFLDLDKNDNEDSRISFFASKGITEINTTLKNFVYDASIKGCKQQDVLNTYRNMITKFNNKNLELIKENLEAYKANDSSLISLSEKKHRSLEKRKYLYTVNYAVTNKDNEVAPYLALTELYDANIKLLDTVNNSLTPSIKTSIYGKELQAFIDKIKANKQ